MVIVRAQLLDLLRRVGDVAAGLRAVAAPNGERAARRPAWPTLPFIRPLPCPLQAYSSSGMFCTCHFASIRTPESVCRWLAESVAMFFNSIV